MVSLLAQLAIDYFDRSRSRGDADTGFDQPIFSLIESVVRELTGDEHFAFDAVLRPDPASFRILVKASGTDDSPIPIQAASQGTALGRRHLRPDLQFLGVTSDTNGGCLRHGGHRDHR